MNPTAPPVPTAPDRTSPFLAARYTTIESAIDDALAAIVDVVEREGRIRDVVAVLVDPWRDPRNTGSDAWVVEHAIGPEFRWVVLRPDGKEWADQLPLLSEFGRRTGAFVELMSACLPSGQHTLVFEGLR